jgi:hypothetical protein
VGPSELKKVGVNRRIVENEDESVDIYLVKDGVKLEGREQESLMRCSTSSESWGDNIAKQKTMMRK